MRQTRCRSGQARAGITCDFAIRTTINDSLAKTRNVTGWAEEAINLAASICTSAELSTPCLHLLYARFWQKVYSIWVMSRNRSRSSAW